MKPYHLRQKQSLPLKAKVHMTKRRIEDWLTHFDNQVYVSWSGGKDSTALLDLVWQINYKIPAVFCDMGLQFPEVKEFVYSYINYPEKYEELGNGKYYYKDHIAIIKPKMNFKEVIKKYGYPIVGKEQAQYIYEYRNTNSEKLRKKRWEGVDGSYKIAEKWKSLVNAPFKISKKCCDVMKKQPFYAYEKETGRTPIMGTMVSESRNRLNSYIRHGCNAFEMKRPRSLPMSFWHEEDVLQYIVENGLEIPSVYGEIVKVAGKYCTTGRKRTGCIFCGFGVHLEKTPNRYQRLAKTHPKLHSYCVNQLGFNEVLDYININYEPDPVLFNYEEEIK